MTTPIPLRLEPRPAVGPGRSMQGAATATAIGYGVASLVVANNPGLVVLEPVITAAVAGVLSGAGNMARNRLESGQPGLGLIVANLFAWLG